MNKIQVKKCMYYIDICRDQLNDLGENLHTQLIRRALKYIEACVDGELDEDTSK